MFSIDTFINKMGNRELLLIEWKCVWVFLFHCVWVFLRYNLYTSDGFQKKLHTAGAFAFLLCNTFINTRWFSSSAENIEYHINRLMNSIIMSLNIKWTRNELHVKSTPLNSSYWTVFKYHYYLHCLWHVWFYYL